MFFDPGALVVEANRRDAVRRGLHPPQRRALEDPSRFRLLRCSRRSGKTHWALSDIIDDHWDWPHEEYAYVALTRSSARNIAWPIIRRLNREFGLKLRFRESIGRVEFPNGAGLTIYGADRDEWAERIYGQDLRKVYIDEASWFKADLQYLVKDVCTPCITRTRGQITLMSIPSPYLRGLYYEADQGIIKGWSCHRWSWTDNPVVRQQVLELFRDELENNPDWLELPGTRRNWLNQWVDEIGMRVYRWTKAKNSIADLDISLDEIDLWRFVLGIDFGWTHRTGFALLGWRSTDPCLYELESFAKDEMELDEIDERLHAYRRAYPRVLMIGDPDAQREFGELTRRYGHPIEPAEKSNKKFWIDLLNNEMGAGRFKVRDPENSAHVAEMLEGTWESRRGVLVRNVRDELIERKGWRNDVCDANLYAFRAVWNFRYRRPTKPPEPGSAEWYALIEAEMMREAEQQAEMAAT